MPVASETPSRRTSWPDASRRPALNHTVLVMIVMIELSTTTSHPKPTAQTRPARKRKRKGGWPTTTGLKWREVKNILALARSARFNVILHIMPADGTDAERKRFVAKTVGHLGQALKRRGQEHSGVTIYEKGPTAGLFNALDWRLERSVLRDMIFRF